MGQMQLLCTVSAIVNGEAAKEFASKASVVYLQVLLTRLGG